MAFDGRTDQVIGMKIKVHMPRPNKSSLFKKLKYDLILLRIQTFFYNPFAIMLLVKICPECGGDLGFDGITKNFVCKRCGLYATREKFEELHDKLNENKQSSHKNDEYLDWWQSSKKEKRIQR